MVLFFPDIGLAFQKQLHRKLLPASREDSSNAETTASLWGATVELVFRVPQQK